MMAELICRDLSLGYDGNVIVKGLSFTVNRGDYLCIIGENGAGKSTLIKTILGLEKPLGGELKCSPKGIGYMPQHTDVQRDFPASVREIVMSGMLNRCGLRPFYNKKEKAEANGIMGRLGILDIADSCYRELSGGQQQRVLLSRALCSTGRLLVLDEPTQGLDPLAAEEFYELIASLNREGMTVIMVSHDMEGAVRYASHILVLAKDTRFYGTKEQYFGEGVQ